MIHYFQYYHLIIPNVQKIVYIPSEHFILMVKNFVELATPTI